MIDEFMNDLDDELKERLLTRFNEAKRYGGETPLQWFNESEAEGFCLGYAEVFGDRDVDKFLFRYKDTEYMVDDQYCSDPECKCNEVILTFIEIISGKAAQEPKFVIRMPLGAGRYEVEYNQQLNRGDMNDILQCFKEHMGNDFSLLKNRYKKMKEFGAMRLKQKKQKQASPLLTA
ncbi:MAG: hypothetical protein U9N81_04335 [Bacillota bacterium]|nr:hypothetical protein [Bacillota bacterium]